MFCRCCGKEIDDREISCPSCGKPTPNIYVSNYLVQAILVTFCCCWPFGIPAIVYAAQVNGKLAMGDVEGASASAASAKMWCWIAVLGFAALFIISFILQILGPAMFSNRGF